MTIKLVLLLTLVLSATIGCNSKLPADAQAAQADPNASTDASPFDSPLGRPFDTVAVTKALSLTGTDSLELHLVSRESPDAFSTDELSVQKVTDDLPPFFFRFVTVSTSDSSSEGGFQAAYLLIYAPVYDLSKVKHFRQGSISFEEGGQQGLRPQFTVADINGDGVNDLIVSFLEDRTGLLDGSFFHHYDTLSASIVADTALDAQFGRQTISFDEKHKEISTGYITGNGQYEFEVYRWDGKGYPHFAKERAERPDENPGILVETREELRAGKWTVVKCDTSR